MSVYVIAGVNVTDPEDYKAYASQTEASVKPFGGRFLVKGGAQTQLEGNSPGRHAVIEFPDRDAALSWYNSDEYQRILPIALSSSDRAMVLIDGVT